MPDLSVQDWLKKVGLPYDPNDPFAQAYQSIAANNTPTRAPKGNAAFIEACLRARGVLYWKNKPGDCGTPTKVDTSKAGTAIRVSESSLGTLSFLSSHGVASLGAGATGAIAGYASLGIGLVAMPVLGILQHHKQAVATEQATLCSMASSVNNTIPQIDAGVRSGQISATQALDYMESLTENLMQGLDTIKKDCNASCVMESVLRSHMDFANIYYPAISPSGTAAAGPGKYSLQNPASLSTPGFPSPQQITQATSLSGSSDWLLITALAAVAVLLIVLVIR